MERIKLKEALEYQREKNPGKTFSNNELAKKLFADSKPKTQTVNMSNLVTGKTTRVTPDLVQKICRATGVDANFLFDVKPMKNQ